MPEPGADAPEVADKWVRQFRFFRNPPDQADIERWLNQFDQNDRPIAERLLDKITVVSDLDIQRGYRNFLNEQAGWSVNSNERTGRWYFVGFGRAGESGPHMLRIFREANQLNAARHDSLFVTLHELPSLKLTAEDTVVFVDDISGSGNQACRLWPTVKELIASEATAILLLTAITYRSKKRLEEETELTLAYRDLLDTNSDFFHADFADFTDAEKARIEHYCAIAEPRRPRGYRGGSVCLNRSRSVYKWISALWVMPQPGLAAAR